MNEYKYLVLNSNNIADCMVTYYQPLYSPPINYLLVEDSSKLWHKYENGQWSLEKYLPDHGQIELSRMEKLEQDNNMLKMQMQWLNDDFVAIIESLF